MKIESVDKKFVKAEDGRIELWQKLSSDIDIEHLKKQKAELESIANITPSQIRLIRELSDNNLMFTINSRLKKLDKDIAEYEKVEKEKPTEKTKNPK